MQFILLFWQILRPFLHLILILAHQTTHHLPECPTAGVLQPAEQQGAIPASQMLQTKQEMRAGRWVSIRKAQAAMTQPGQLQGKLWRRRTRQLTGARGKLTKCPLYCLETKHRFFLFSASYQFCSKIVFFFPVFTPFCP